MYDFLIITILIGALIFAAKTFIKLKEHIELLDAKEKDLAISNRKVKSLGDEFNKFKDRMVYLQKYEQVDDAEVESKRLLKEARAKSTKLKESADKILQDAIDSSRKMHAASEERASQIAGEAWDAKKNADLYAATEKAMKNAIKGYGNEYLVPNESAIDEMAFEYDHKEAGQELAKCMLLFTQKMRLNSKVLYTECLRSNR